MTKWELQCDQIDPERLCMTVSELANESILISMIGKLKSSIHFIQETSDDKTASPPPYLFLSVCKVKVTVKSRPWAEWE